MVYRRYKNALSMRLLELLIAVYVLMYFIQTPGFHAATLLMVLVVTLIIANLYRHINRTNTEVTRFFDAVRYRDFSQRFDYQDLPSNFKNMGTRFSEVIVHLQQSYKNKETAVKRLSALIEHVPVPLLSLHQDDSVTLWNNSARRLFSEHSVVRKSDFKRYGAPLLETLSSLAPGEVKLTEVKDNNFVHSVKVQASAVMFAGKQETLVSLQDIQTELDGAQLKAWQDLVSVLTHEIMNSITPVTSLAKTSVDLLHDVSAKNQDVSLKEDLEDASDAVATVARRSDGLMNFVSSYRRLTRLPPAKRKRVYLHELLNHALKVATPGFKTSTPMVSLNIEPEHLQVELDTEMVEQLLINVLQNAAHALEGQAESKISIHAYLNKRGRTVIDIGDNGPGVPESVGEQVFVPFFTTKRDGSGVGLALTRQIMQAHGGSVRLGKSKLGGAEFSLRF